ncbi:zinc finger protein 595-like [Planococcus citri]|uniref:zinc finger protein 595-like n=1 Tax=Planococcus citri TaxID=170843 RepID=UPI0031F7DAF5
MHNEHCRLCGNQNNEMFDIFSETGSNKQLESKIKEIVRLNISPDDSLPKTVCVSCINHLENASHFVDQCHQTQTYLSQLYEEIILPTPAQNSFRAPNHAEKIRVVLNDRADIEINLTKLRSILTCKIESDQINLENDSIENNSSQIISALPDHNDTNQNSTQMLENSNAVQNDSNSYPSTSNSEPDGNTSHKKNPTPIEKISDVNLDSVPSNDTLCSSTNDSQETPLANTQNCTTSNRSRLKRKCTMRTTPINDHPDSSDEENREPDERSDYSDDLTNKCNENRNSNTKKPKLQTELRPFSCKLCKSSFKTVKMLNRHIKTVHSDKRLKCSICDYIGKDHVILKIHMKNTHFKPYVCAICDYRTGLKFKIRNHIVKKHTPASWTLNTNEENDDDRSSFCCATCGKTFYGKMNYQKHMSLQHSIRPFSCNLCTSSFRVKQDLTNHINTIHSDKKLKCPICDYVAKYQSKLTEHMKSTHYKPFACAICDWRTGDKKRIRLHIVSKHLEENNDKNYSCATCKITFSHELTYQKHLKVHSGKGKFSCELCRSSFEAVKMLNRHIKTVHPDKRFKCSICGYIGKDHVILKKHMKNTHFKPYVCAICDYRTGQKFKIRNHIVKKHTPASWTLNTNEENDDDRSSFCCATCGKTFYGKMNYQKHMSLQHSIRPFACNLCTSSFRDKQGLTTHIKTIHSEKRFKCPTCDYVCTSNGKLSRHLKCAHDKPLTCAICGFKTGMKSHIRKHITSQHIPASCSLKENTKKNDKRFFCLICKKTFARESTYQEHLNVHSGKRPFSCKLCTSSFRVRSLLNYHLRTVHSDKQFKCPTCDYVAKYKSKLTAHMRCAHEKPLTCDDCGYRTGEKRRLQRHIASKHTSSMSLVCEVCGKELATSITLHYHMKNIHFPEPKVCQTCGKVCPSNSKYSQHILKCGKKKEEYECEKCGQTYSIKANLLEHMNKHLNRKPYKCKVCGMAFYQRIRLHTHKFVHRGANFQCEICDRPFKRKDNMKSHMKRQHSKK